MSSFLARYSTPLTAGLFAVSAISGLFLFLNTGQSLFHEMHEWLSVVLLVPFIVHVWRNWPALIGYARRRTLVWPLLISVFAALAFAAQGMNAAPRGGSPFRAVQALTRAPLTQLAPIVGTTPEALLSKLRGMGVAVDSPASTFDQVAIAAHRSPAELLFGVLPGP